MCSKPCRVKYMFTEEGEKVRVSRQSGRVIPKPIELLERKTHNEHAGKLTVNTFVCQ